MNIRMTSFLKGIPVLGLAFATLFLSHSVRNEGADPPKPKPGIAAPDAAAAWQRRISELVCENLPLGEIVKDVYTVEYVEALGLEDKARLAALGYKNVHVRIGDGYYGWPEAAPFDVIVVTAVAGHIPPPLLKQLKPGGRMVIPLGASFMTQYLMLVEKRQDGSITTRQIVPVSFVPLTGGH